MRALAFLLVGLALTLFLTAVYPTKPSVANQVVRTVHPVASIGDVFRGH